MADETVDRKYKRAYNVAYHMAKDRDADEILEKIIGKLPDGPERNAWQAGREQNEKELQAHYHEHLRDEFSSNGRTATDADILKKYYDGMQGDGDDLLEKAIEKEKAERDGPDDPDRGPDGPAMPAPEQELTEEEDAARISEIFEKEWNERNPPKESFKPSDRVGQGPPLTPEQIKEYEEWKVQERSRLIQQQAREASRKLEDDKDKER